MILIFIRTAACSPPQWFADSNFRTKQLKYFILIRGLKAMVVQNNPAGRSGSKLGSDGYIAAVKLDRDTTSPAAFPASSPPG